MSLDQRETDEWRDAQLPCRRCHGTGQVEYRVYRAPCPACADEAGLKTGGEG